jgi:tetratricopeptide (TPR) repeat protein
MRTAIAEHGLEARIGINTGEVVVGGEDETLVTGDAVNVAARLEQVAASGETLIGAETRLLVRDAVVVEPATPLELKGKSEPVDAFRLIEVLPDAAPLARRLEIPLVGRERERQRLWRDYEDAVADHTCRLFTLLGPAGIGKSRLVADFLDRIGEASDVLRGRCLSYGEGITYWPLVEMLVPLGIDPESVVASTPEETRVAFRRLLEARAADRPQVVVVDDLQWAERVFVDLVEHVADVSRGASIFLLCIARTELLDVRPDWGGGKLNATSLLLEPLDAAECGELMSRLVPETELDLALKERITVASAGNPLYVEEMLAMLRETDGGDVAVPPTIHALLQARIDSLESDVRTVLERGAVEGEVFHRGAVAALVPAELQAGVDDHLTGLVRRELIRPDDALLPGEDAFRFRHLLIRDAAYAAMPKEQRARLHESFANWLEQTVAKASFERDEILGYHLERAFTLRAELGHDGPAEQKLASQAGGKLVAAGLRAVTRGDAHAAATLLGRGIALLPSGDPKRLGAQSDHALALARIGAFDESMSLLRATVADAAHRGDTRVEARARLTLMAVETRIDPNVRMVDQLQQALEIASRVEAIGDAPTLVKAYERIGSTRFMLGRAGDGELDLRTAAELAVQAGEQSLALEISSARLRPMLYGPTPASDGLLHCRHVYADAGHQLAIAAHASQAKALFAAMQGDFDLARAADADLLPLIEELGLVLLRGIYTGDIAYALVIAGELDRAESVLRAGDERLVHVGETGVRATVTAQLADVLARQGEFEEALRYIDESNAIAAPDDLDAQPRWRVALARALLGQGDVAAADRIVREAIALLDPTDFIDLHADALDVLGDVLVRDGRVEDAAVALQGAIALHEQKGNVVSAARSRAALDELPAVPRS